MLRGQLPKDATSIGSCEVKQPQRQQHHQLQQSLPRQKPSAAPLTPPLHSAASSEWAQRWETAQMPSGLSATAGVAPKAIASNVISNVTTPRRSRRSTNISERFSTGRADHIATYGGSWQHHHQYALPAALRIARTVSEVERLVDLYGDQFKVEHVAAALQVLTELVPAPPPPSPVTAPIPPNGAPHPHNIVRTTPQQIPEDKGLPCSTPEHPAHVISPAELFVEAPQPTTNDPRALAQAVAHRLLSIAQRLLKGANFIVGQVMESHTGTNPHQRRQGPSNLLALLVQPRRLGIVPEHVWVLPVLKQLIAVLPSLDPEQLVLLLETLAEREMWEFAPASGTVARRLTLRMAQQLEVALPRLPVCLAARALGAVARLAPRGFGPFLVREAQRDAGGYAVQWAVRRAREAAAMVAAETGPNPSALGHATGTKFGNGGDGVRELSNHHPAVIAWAGQHMDRTFAASYMSYIHVALSRREVRGEDAVRFLEAIARFVHWPGVSRLRALGETAPGTKSTWDPSGGGGGGGGGGSAAPSIATTTAGDCVSTAAVRTSSLLHAAGGAAASYRVSEVPLRRTAVKDAPRMAPYLHHSPLLDERAPGVIGSDQELRTQDVSTEGATKTAVAQTIAVRTEYSLRPVRRVLLLPRAAQSPSSPLSTTGSGIRCGTTTTTSLPPTPGDEAPAGHSPPTSKAASSATAATSDPHTATLLDLIDLLPYPESTNPTISSPAVAAAPSVRQHLDSEAEPEGLHLELYCNAFWAMVRLGVRPSAPWVSCLLAASQPRLTTLQPGTLVRVWWALSAVRWAPGPGWRATAMGALLEVAAALTPDQLCLILGGCATWGFLPSASWVDELLAQMQPKLHTFGATSCTALAFALARMAYRPHTSLRVSYLEQCSSQLPYMDGRNLVNLMWALHRLQLHTSLSAEWRLRFLTASRGLMPADATSPAQQQQQQWEQQRWRIAASKSSHAAGAGLWGRYGSGSNGTAAARYKLRLGLVAAGSRPPPAHRVFSAPQLALLLLMVAKAGLSPDPLWQADFWRASELSLPYMPPVALAALLNGVWHLRMSPPLRWMRAFFATSGAALETTSPSVIVHFAELLLRTPMRPPGIWVRQYRTRLDNLTATLSRVELNICMDMIRRVSWRRRRTAPPGWMLRSARTQAEAADRWRRSQEAAARRRHLLEKKEQQRLKAQRGPIAGSGQSLTPAQTGGRSLGAHCSVPGRGVYGRKPPRSSGARQHHLAAVAGRATLLGKPPKGCKGGTGPSGFRERD